MGSPTFGMTPGNNAPPPMFGSHTNPTGGGYGGGGGGFNFPMYGGIPTSTTGTVSPTANMPLFSGTNDGMASLSSGFDLGNNWKDLANRLGKAYGKGPGQAIYNMLSEGLFNPQTAAAFLNAMQPSVQRGQANLLSSFGAEGSRFGSAAALGLGDFNSQVNLNEQQTLASMYMQAQQEQLQLLEGVLPGLHAEKANEGGWMHSLTGFLDNFGAIGQLFGSGLGGGNSGSNGNTFLPLSMGNMNTGTFGNNAPSWQTTGGQFDEIAQWNQSSSAASLFGGAGGDGSSIPSFMYGLF